VFLLSVIGCESPSRQERPFEHVPFTPNYYISHLDLVRWGFKPTEDNNFLLQKSLSSKMLLEYEINPQNDSVIIERQKIEFDQFDLNLALNYLGDNAASVETPLCVVEQEGNLPYYNFFVIGQASLRYYHCFFKKTDSGNGLLIITHHFPAIYYPPPDDGEPIPE
jgi:hypothetical protein